MLAGGDNDDDVDLATPVTLHQPETELQGADPKWGCTSIGGMHFGGAATGHRRPGCGSGR